MGKRIKPKSLLNDEQQIDAVNEQTVEESNAEMKQAYSENLLGNGKMTAEAKEKLEKYDALEATVLELNQKNQMLEEKLAEYAEKLESSKSNSDEVKKMNDEILNLKKQLNEAKVSKTESKTEFDLKNKCKQLREEADEYLVKISELTFENANLTCQLNELKKNSNVSHPQRTNSPLAQPRKDPYNPYKNNGYGTW